MTVAFSTDDLKTAESLERVLRQFQVALNAPAVAVQPPSRATVDIGKIVDQVLPLVRDQLQAPGATPLNLQSLLPPQVTSITAGSGISVSTGTGDTTVTNTGVTSIAGTANQIAASAATGAVTLSTPQNIDTAAAVQFGSLNLSTKFIVNSSGLPTKSNNIALVGQGVALVVASASSTAQTGANSDVAHVTTGASGGSFEIGGYIDVTAFTAGTVSLQCDYTDDAGGARTLVIPLSDLTGAIGTTVGSATVASAIAMSIRTSGANTIKLYTTVAGWTGQYNVFCWIKEIA